jgi:hypothetical protein
MRLQHWLEDQPQHKMRMFWWAGWVAVLVALLW